MTAISWTPRPDLAGNVYDGTIPGLIGIAARVRRAPEPERGFLGTVGDVRGYWGSPRVAMDALGREARRMLQEESL